MVAVAPRDLLHRASQEHHRVGAGEAGERRQRELELARAEFHLERAKRQAEALEAGAQQLHDRVDQVVALLGQVLVAGRQQLDVGRRAGLAGIRWAQIGVGDAEDVELNLQPGDELIVAEGSAGIDAGGEFALQGDGLGLRDVPAVLMQADVRAAVVPPVGTDRRQQGVRRLFLKVQIPVPAHPDVPQRRVGRGDERPDRRLDVRFGDLAVGSFREVGARRHG